MASSVHETVLIFFPIFFIIIMNTIKLPDENLTACNLLTASAILATKMAAVFSSLFMYIEFMQTKQ